MNSVSLNRSIEAAYKLSIILYSGFLHDSCHVVSLSKGLCCFLSIMLAMLFTFSFVNAYE